MAVLVLKRCPLHAAAPELSVHEFRVCFAAMTVVTLAMLLPSLCFEPWRKIAAGEEEREHGAGGQLVVVRGPRHARQRRSGLREVPLVRERRAALVEGADVKPHPLERAHSSPRGRRCSSS